MTTLVSRFFCLLSSFALAVLACAQSPQPDAGRNDQDNLWNSGLLFDRFELTLATGQRTEAVGPFYYREQADTRRTWAIPPLLSYTRDPGTESQEFDFIYPVLTFDRYGDQYRWQFFQLLSLASTPTLAENVRSRFTLFPIYFQQRSTDPTQNYTALFPVYGHLKHRLMRDETFFVLFPLYSQTQKRGTVTDNYLYPIFHRRHGEKLSGWQVWPLAGHEHKDVTTRTNGFGDLQAIPGHDRWFALWPLIFRELNDIGTPNPRWEHAVLPAYSLVRSPGRDATTVLWPFFAKIEDREKKYREWQAPYPVVVFARGEGKTISRVWPIFSQAHSPILESDAYLWPLYKFNRITSAPLDRQRTRILYYLFSNMREKNTETGQQRRRVDCWPLFTHRREFDGSARLQVLALLEPILPESRPIERDYSPVWSVWRAEANAQTGARSQSLLWNLYRHESAPDRKKCSLLFGLFQYQSSPEGNRWRLFYIPLGQARSPKTTNGSAPGTARSGELRSPKASA